MHCGSELVSVTASLADDIEPVCVAGAGHRRVDPLAVGLVARKDERVAAGQALSCVAGERVAVLERRPAIVGRLREEASVELDEPVVEADAERTRGGIDALDDAAVAVAHVAAAMEGLRARASSVLLDRAQEYGGAVRAGRDADTGVTINLPDGHMSGWLNTEMP